MGEVEKEGGREGLGLLVLVMGIGILIFFDLGPGCGWSCWLIGLVWASVGAFWYYFFIFFFSSSFFFVSLK